MGSIWAFLKAHVRMAGFRLLSFNLTGKKTVSASILVRSLWNSAIAFTSSPRFFFNPFGHGTGTFSLFLCYSFSLLFFNRCDTEVDSCFWILYFRCYCCYCRALRFLLIFSCFEKFMYKYMFLSMFWLRCYRCNALFSLSFRKMFALIFASWFCMCSLPIPHQLKVENIKNISIDTVLSSRNEN